MKVCRLNAKAVKAIGDAALKRTITDAVSAENTCAYLVSFPEKITYAASSTTPADKEEWKASQSQSTYLRMLQKQKVQLSNQLEKLLYQYFLEVLLYCRHGMPTWLLRVLSSYPCATALTKATESKLASIKGISTEKAKALVEKAAHSAQIVSPQIQRLIRETAKEILHKEALVKTEKHYLIALHREKPQPK